MLVVLTWSVFSVTPVFCVQIYQLQEKDTQSKLEILFKKNLYQLAIE